MTRQTSPESVLAWSLTEGSKTNYSASLVIQFLPLENEGKNLVSAGHHYTCSSYFARLLRRSNTLMHACEMFATLKLRELSLLLRILMIIYFVLTGKKKWYQWFLNQGRTGQEKVTMCANLLREIKWRLISSLIDHLPHHLSHQILTNQTSLSENEQTEKYQ